MAHTPLSTDFKDDILHSSVERRKYHQIFNEDGSVSFVDVTPYLQTGSVFGAKEVNEERNAINNIDERRIVTLDEIDLVTEEGFFVDALAVKELNGKIPFNLYYNYCNSDYMGLIERFCTSNQACLAIIQVGSSAINIGKMSRYSLSILITNGLDRHWILSQAGAGDSNISGFNNSTIYSADEWNWYKNGTWIGQGKNF